MQKKMPKDTQQTINRAASGNGKSIRTGGKGNFHYLLITKDVPDTVVTAGNTARKDKKVPADTGLTF